MIELQGSLLKYGSRSAILNSNGAVDIGSKQSGNNEVLLRLNFGGARVLLADVIEITAE